MVLEKMRSFKDLIWVTRENTPPPPPPPPSLADSFQAHDANMYFNRVTVSFDIGQMLSERQLMPVLAHQLDEMCIWMVSNLKLEHTAL